MQRSSTWDCITASMCDVVQFNGLIKLHINLYSVSMESQDFSMLTQLVQLEELAVQDVSHVCTDALVEGLHGLKKLKSLELINVYEVHFSCSHDLPTQQASTATIGD